MVQSSLRYRLESKKLDSLHLQYLLALADMENGEELLVDMINIYLQTAREILELATHFAHESNKPMFLQTVRQLGEGSERLGARRLTRMAQELSNTKDVFPILTALDSVANEFVRVEIDLKEFLAELEATAIA
jgi:hypothetical protein